MMLIIVCLIIALHEGHGYADRERPPSNQGGSQPSLLRFPPKPPGVIPIPEEPLHSSGGHRTPQEEPHFRGHGYEDHHLNEPPYEGGFKPSTWGNLLTPSKFSPSQEMVPGLPGPRPREHHHHKEKQNKGRGSFGILLKRTDLVHVTRAEDFTNNTYEFENGSSIELTCYHTDQTKLEWIDDHSFTTGTSDIDGRTAVRIRIKTDLYDNNTRLRCKAHNPEKEVYTYLLAATGHVFPDVDIIYIQVNENYLFLTASCNGELYKPGKSSFSKVSINDTITQTFTKSDNETTVLCIKYTEVPNENDNYNHIVYTYERKRWKFVYIISDKYTDENEDARNDEEPPARKDEEPPARKDEEPPGRKDEEPPARKDEQDVDAKETTITMQVNNDGSTNEDTKKKIAIIAGTLGAVIIILLLIIAINCYKNRRRVSTDDTDEVIYEEIIERPSQPALKIQNTYAQILGTKIPKLSDLNEEPVYCTLE